MNPMKVPTRVIGPLKGVGKCPVGTFYPVNGVWYKNLTLFDTCAGIKKRKNVKAVRTSNICSGT